jgi:hypothetical protein
MKKFSILLVIALLATLFLVPGVSAQSITWTSGFQVQNLSSSTANIVVKYYNQDGSKAIADVSASIPGMGSKTYFPIDAADGFNGSVVVEGDQPIVAIANTLGNNPQYTAATESFAAGATEIGLPLIMRNNGGYFTWFNVQNAGSSAASVQVQYVPGDAGSAHTESATIQPGAAATFNQRDVSQLGAKFVGSAVVTSDQPIVATVMQVGEAFKNMLGYNGFTGGSNTVSLPLIMANNGGYYTGFQVQNVGTAATDVTIAYGPGGPGSTFSPSNETATLQPGKSTTFLQNGGQWAGQTYVGSATITTSGQPVVAIVNQVKQTGVAVGTAYNGFDPDNATDKVSAPLIMANNSNYYTGIQIMNVGTSATNITVDYGPNTAGTFDPPNETASLAAGASKTYIQASGAWTGNKYVGSATVTASGGGKIVMIVNQIRQPAQGDQFMTYDGFNY